MLLMFVIKNSAKNVLILLDYFISFFWEIFVNFLMSDKFDKLKIQVIAKCTEIYISLL